MVKRYLELRKKRWFRWSADVAIILSVIFVAGLWQTQGHLKGAAPDFALKTLGGGTVSLESLKGKPVILAFWAPWCGVCKMESGNFSWVKRLVGDRAHVLSVASAFDQINEVQDYVANNGVDYPVLLDVDQLSQQFKVSAFPTVYFLDSSGQVKRSAVGYTTTLGLLLRVAMP